MTYNPQGQQSSFTALLQQILGAGQQTGQLPQIQPLKQKSPIDDMINQTLQQPQAIQPPQQQGGSQGMNVLKGVSGGQSLGDSFMQNSKLGQFAKLLGFL